MIEVYSALVLHSAGKEINEENIKKIIEAAGAQVDETKIKALVAALEGVDIDKALEEAAFVTSAVGAKEEAKEEKKEEEEEDKAKKEQEAVAGLGALFG